MIVSIVITAYNEENYLPKLLEDIKKQTYRLKSIEVILMNSLSTDRTLEVMEQFKENEKENFYNVQVIENVKKIQSAGFNLGVTHAKGDVILKIDAHASVPENFVLLNVREIENGAYVCGGRRPTIVEGTDDFSKTLHIVEESALGSSIANYRKSETKQVVNSIFHGMYRKEVFDTVGLEDEQLLRTEDNEFHYRIRKAGYEIIFNPEIESFQYIRPTLKKMLHQKFGNGYWIGLTSHVCRQCLSLFHFVPGVFVASLILASLLTIVSSLPLIILISTYLLTILVLSVFEISQQPFNKTLVLIPFLMIAIHVSYGLGTVKGWLEGYSWKKSYRK